MPRSVFNEVKLKFGGFTMLALGIELHLIFRYTLT